MSSRLFGWWLSATPGDSHLARLEAEPELLHELRIPSSLALQVGSDLRAEGRAAESRTLTERMREHVEEAGLYLRFFWGLQLQARIEMAIGSSWTDEDQPRRAEQEPEDLFIFYYSGHANANGLHLGDELLRKGGAGLGQLETGIDLEKLWQAGQVAEAIVGRDLPGKVHRAGVRSLAR